MKTYLALALGLAALNPLFGQDTSQTPAVAGHVNSHPLPQKEPLANVQVIQSVVQRKEDHAVILEKIAPPPAAEVASKNTDVTSPQRQTSPLVNRQPTVMIGVGATVYDHANSLLTWRKDDQNYSAWVNFDVHCAIQAGTFEVSGVTYELCGFPMDVDTAKVSQFLGEHGRAYTAPCIPQFPSTAPSLIVVSGDAANASALAPINAMIQNYQANAAALKLKYAQRVADAAAQAEYDKAHPRPTRNTTIQFWRRDSSNSQPAQNGGAR